MKKTYRLELNFRTEEGKSKRISIDNPILELTEEEVIPAMQTIIDCDIFGVDRDTFVAIDNARYVETTINEIYSGDKK